MNRPLRATHLTTALAVGLLAVVQAAPLSAQVQQRTGNVWQRPAQTAGPTRAGSAFQQSDGARSIYAPRSGYQPRGSAPYRAPRQPAFPSAPSGTRQRVPAGGSSPYALPPGGRAARGGVTPAYGAAPTGVHPRGAVQPAYGTSVPSARQPVQLTQQLDFLNRPAYELIPPARPGDHPLVQAVEWARLGLKRLEMIQDYSATVAKRERINGKLRDYEYFFVKIRHKPFSVYLYFLSPENLRGQEVIYVEGKNDGKMWAHTVGIRGSLIGTVSLSPTGVIAMKDQRYPLTEIGIKNLTKRLIEVGEQDMKYGECEVRFFRGAKVNDRSCTCLQVVHPVPRRNFLFHIARVFVDDELNIPIRYESYSWPTEPGGPPVLLEEYTYLDIKLNNGFTDLDFDPKNPNYGFP